MIDRGQDATTAAELTRLARLFLNHGKHDAADTLLEAAAALDPGNPAIAQVQAVTAYRAGRYAQAIELSRLGRTTGSTDPRAGAEAKPRGLAAMGLSLIEAMSLIGLGRVGEGRKRYETLAAGEVAASSPTDGATVEDRLRTSALEARADDPVSPVPADNPLVSR